MTVNFSSETLEARRKQQNIFQMLRENNCQPTIFTENVLQKLGEIEIFSDERKLKEFAASSAMLK